MILNANMFKTIINFQIFKFIKLIILIDDFNYFSLIYFVIIHYFLSF